MFDKKPVKRRLTDAGISDQLIQKQFAVDVAANEFDPPLQSGRQSGTFRLFAKFDQQIVCKDRQTVMQTGQFGSAKVDDFVETAFDFAPVSRTDNGDIIQAAGTYQSFQCAAVQPDHFFVGKFRFAAHRTIGS